MENKENIKVTAIDAAEEENLKAMLQAFSERTDLPRGTVDEIFYLGMRTERERQALIRGSKVLKDLKKEKKKAEKKQKPKRNLFNEFMRKIGYAPIPKEPKQEEEKKELEKNEETKK